SGNHHLWTFGGEVRGYYQGKYGAGLAYERLWRRSNYTFNADVDQNDSEFRAFLSLTIPRWEQ
ncbi:MAG TPA: hypothetical protein VFU03_05940, partial [Gemmatimonadales bacterium]|nr:hypothetical protein [Gemmatimonadales bacterium]